MWQVFVIIGLLILILVFLSKIESEVKNIMPTLRQTLTEIKAFQDAQSAAIDGIVASQAGLAGDIAALNAKITELQESAGKINAEDQALLDEIQAGGAAAAAKATAVAEELAALDAQTPPVVPPIDPATGNPAA
jgi:peptidoglycan hydrolase CwlO-like protein